MLTIQSLNDEFVRTFAPLSNCGECEKIRQSIKDSPTRFKFYIEKLIERKKGFRMSATGVYWEVYPEELKANSCGCGGAIVEEKKFNNESELTNWAVAKFYSEAFHNISIHEERDYHQRKPSDFKPLRNEVLTKDMEDTKRDQ